MNLAGDFSRMARFIYSDSAGDDDHSPIMVRSVVLVDIDRQWFPINRDVIEIVEEDIKPYLVTTKDFEFHAYDLFSTKNRDLGGKEARWRCLNRFMGLIDKYKLPVIYAAISKVRAKPEVWLNAQTVCFTRCIAEAENWLAQSAPREGAIIVADRTVNENYLRSKTIAAREDGWFSPLSQDELDPQEIRLDHIADTVHFANSKDSWGIQLADCCSFFLKRYFMKLEVANFMETFRSQIVAHFDRL